MKMEDSKLLAALFQAGTIRGAAKSLYISQPAVSQRLKSIEAAWGETLFIRTHQQLIATPIGEKVAAHAIKVLESEQRLKEEISQTSTEVQGSLSLGVSTLIGQYLLPDVLDRYLSKYPLVNIQLVTGISKQIEASFEDYHVAIVRGKRPAFKETVLLMEEPLYYIENKDTARRSTFIEFQTDDNFQTAINEWLLMHPEFIPKSTLKVDQIETCKQMLLRNIGACVLPAAAVQNIPREHFHFHLMKKNEHPLLRSTWLHYNKKVKALPQVRAFIELLLEELQYPDR